MIINPYLYPGITSEPIYVVPKVLLIKQGDIFSSQKKSCTEARQILFFIHSLEGMSQKQIAERYELPKQTVSSALMRIKQLLIYYENVRLKVATIVTKCNLTSEYTSELNKLKKY